MIRRGATALVAVLVTLLAGCASIPTAGNVHVGPTQDVKNQDVVLVPYPPAQNASPTDIVQGFITAATGQQNDYRVARQFLTPALATRWRPDARVLVHDQAWQVNAASDTSLTVTVPTTAEVNTEGVYTSYPTAKTRTVPFQLTKVGGQWRIASTPDGIVLGTNYFGSLFTARPVSYFAPAWSQAVPDLRWFPARRITPKGVVQALLAGQSAPIAAPVTATSFPAGTTVTTVQVASGVATVDLDTGDTLPSSTALRRMRQQLTNSLIDLDGIQQVQVAVNGTPMPAPDLPQPSTIPDPAALVLQNGRVGYLSGSTFSAETVLGRQIAATKPLAGTVSVSERTAALRTAAGVELVTPASSTTVDNRPALADPTLDDRGWVYSVPEGDPTAWKAFDSRGHSVPVAVDIPDVVSITAIEASRDGTRMLVLAQTQRGPTAFVAGIVRNATGTPLALTTDRYPVQLPSSATAIDATWVDAPGSSVAVLTQDDTGDSVTVQQLGGLPSLAGRLSTANVLVGATGPKDLRALLQNGAIAEQSGSVWQATEPAGAADVLFVQR